MDMFAKTHSYLKQEFLALEKEAVKMCLTLIQKKTKYRTLKTPLLTCIFVLINVKNNFVYQGSEVNANNIITSEL